MTTTDFEDLLLEAQDALFECDYGRCIKKCEEALSYPRAVRGHFGTLSTTDAQIYETLSLAQLSVQRYKDAVVTLLRWLGDPFKNFLQELSGTSQSQSESVTSSQPNKNTSSSMTSTSVSSPLTLLKQLRLLSLAVYYTEDLSSSLRFRLLADITQWQWTLYDELTEETTQLSPSSSSSVLSSASTNSNSFSGSQSSTSDPVHVISDELEAFNRLEEERESTRTKHEMKWLRHAVAMDISLSLTLLTECLLSLSPSPLLIDSVALVRDGLTQLLKLLPLSSSFTSLASVPSLLLTLTNPTSPSPSSSSSSTSQNTSTDKSDKNVLDLSLEEVQQMILLCTWMSLVLARVEKLSSEREQIRANLMSVDVLSRLTGPNLMFAVSLLTLDHLDDSEFEKATALFQYFRTHSAFSSQLDWTAHQLQALALLLVPNATSLSSSPSFSLHSFQTKVGIHPLLLHRLHIRHRQNSQCGSLVQTNESKSHK